MKLKLKSETLGAVPSPGDRAQGCRGISGDALCLHIFLEHLDVELYHSIHREKTTGEDALNPTMLRGTHKFAVSVNSFAFWGL